MHKIMLTAAAAALIGTVSAIESANVVGYQNIPQSKYKVVGPSFVSCAGTEDIVLGDLKVNCDEEDAEATTGWAANQDKVDLLSEEGNITLELVYVPQWLAEVYNEDPDMPGYPNIVKGWYKEVDVGSDMKKNYNDEPVNFGEAVIVNKSSENSDVNITFSGAVKKDPTITDVSKYVVIANCSPKDIVLGDLKVNCDEEDAEATTGWAANQDKVDLLSEEGNITVELVYVPQWLAEVYNEDPDMPGYPNIVKGWYKEVDVGSDMTKNYNNQKIKAGEGFLVNKSSENADATIQIDPAL